MSKVDNIFHTLILWRNCRIFIFFKISFCTRLDSLYQLVFLTILCQQQFADTNRYWGFPTLLLLVEYLFAFVSLFPLYLTGIGGNLPDNVSSSFLFTKLLLVEIILTTCLAISCVGIFLHPQFSIGGNLCFVVLMSYQQPCFTIILGYFGFWDKLAWPQPYTCIMY